MAYEPKYYTVIWFDPLELHFFSYILRAYIAHMYLCIQYILKVGGASFSQISTQY